LGRADACYFIAFGALEVRLPVAMPYRVLALRRADFDAFLVANPEAKGIMRTAQSRIAENEGGHGNVVQQ
jgi:hypothetical protein